MLELQAIGERLISLAPGQLATVPMPEDLQDAVAMARQMKKHGALNRQKQYIGKLMRQIDDEPIRQALSAIDEAGLLEKKAHHDAELWRDRLINDGSTALEMFLEDYPAVDRQQLRQAMRLCEKHRDAGDKTAGRRLYRLLHDVLVADLATNNQAEVFTLDHQG